MNEVIEQLSDPFPVEAISWRVGATTKDKSKGIALAYIDARDVMERLDKIVGAENWQCRYPFAGCCEVGIRIDGEWIWKANGAGETDYEGTKGMYSDSLKRAAVLWGVGRYLYNLPNVWVPIVPAGKSYKISSPPELPQWARPKATAGFPTGPAVDMKVDVEKMTDIITQCRDVVDQRDDDEETGAKEAKDIYQPLNKAERSWLAGQLNKVKPEGTTSSYWTVFHKHLQNAV